MAISAISALSNLLGSGMENRIRKGAVNALQKTTKKAVKETVKDAVEDSATKAITKSARNAIADSVTDAAVKAMPKKLTGAGKSTLAKNAGSTLDGIIGKSSGITLKNAKKQSLKELTGYNSLGEAIENMGMTVDDLGKGKYKSLSRRNLKAIKDGAQEAKILSQEAMEGATGGVEGGISAKTQLPKLNRQQYYDDTIGKMKNRGGSMSYADVPEYMQSHLVNAGRGGEANSIRNDEVLRLLFGDYDSPISDLYARYEDIASSDIDMAKTYTPDNIDMGLFMQGEAKKNAIEQDFADRLGGARDIPIDGGSGRAQKVKVGKPQAMTETVADAVEPVAGTVTNPQLAEDIASLRERIGTRPVADAGAGGGSINTAPTDVAGSEGFNIKLKDGTPTNITVGTGAVGSSKQQRAFRKLDDMAAKNMNATSKQYKGLMEKSGSVGGHYKTVAERMRKEAIDQANVGQKAQTALALREDIKQQGLQYAERNGVKLDLSGIDNTIGLSATQKRKLAELGLGLDDMLGGNGVVTPTQAEDIYKTLRDYAYNWSDSKDALTKMAGNACEKEAEAVRKIIDDAMDNINVDYKSSLLEMAAQNGEDPAYLRSVAAKPDFKFSDLRRDQSDWIKINDLAGNKIKEEPTINILGVDTGINNPFTAGGDKIKEKIYERQAYGAGGAGAGAGGPGGDNMGSGVPPTGTEGDINFNTVGGNKPGISGRLKDAGLVGGGILGGLLLGGGNGGGSSQASGSTLGDVLAANQAQQQQDALGGSQGLTGASTDPYYGYTVGGYTYDELAEGYARALQAGDASAAESIAKLMGVIEDKASQALTQQKYADSQKSSSSNNSSTAVNVLSQLYDLYNNIKGGTGPIAGNVTNFMNTITGGGYNTEANTYWQVSRGALGKLIKGMGDTGALSEGDQKRALQMIPNVTDTREAAEQKFMALYNILSSAAQQ